MPEGLPSLRHARAKLLFETAERLDAGAPTRATTLAQVDLYRQAAYWGLLSMAPPETRAWPQLLLGLPGVSEQAAALLAAGPEADEALDEASLSTARVTAAEAARRVMALADAPDAAEGAYWHRRVVRWATVMILVMVAVPAVVLGVQQLLKPEDLAKGKPWRASSKLTDCHPEQIECGGVRTPIFFHTLQENEPWVEIDLGTPTEFSAVDVYNRSDGWGDRAFPLGLEVSDDQQSWQLLARQDNELKVWRVKFAPVKARFVRLRALRNTLLHLDSVRVYR